MGIGYSLKRLDALEAKRQRQKYIEEKYPQIKDVALTNWFTSCIYQGQMVLLNLKGEQLCEAKFKINSVVKQIKLTSESVKNLSLGTRVWIYLAKISFWGTCWIKNLLKKGF